MGRRIGSAVLALVFVLIFAALEDLGSRAADDESNNSTAASPVVLARGAGAGSSATATLSSLPPRLAERAEREKAHLSGVLRAVTKGPKHMSRGDRTNVLAHAFQAVTILALISLVVCLLVAELDTRRPAAISLARELAAEEARGLVVDDDAGPDAQAQDVPCDGHKSVAAMPSFEEAAPPAPPARDPAAATVDNIPYAPQGTTAIDAASTLSAEPKRDHEPCQEVHASSSPARAPSAEVMGIASAAALADSALARARLLMTTPNTDWRLARNSNDGKKWAPRLELDDDENGEVC